MDNKVFLIDLAARLGRHRVTIMNAAKKLNFKSRFFTRQHKKERYFTIREVVSIVQQLNKNAAIKSSLIAPQQSFNIFKSYHRIMNF